jgi:hypothetical protein
MNEDTIAETLPAQPGVSLELDWVQYFKDFCEAHGKYPVLHGGLLLFPDGWRYSPDDYMGPEYPPPKDKYSLFILQRAYYTRRLEIVRAECIQLEQVLKDIDSLQARKSVPLSQRVSYKGDDDKLVIGNQRIDLTMMRKRLEWLRDDVDVCEKRLKELTYTNGSH